MSNCVPKKNMIVIDNPYAQLIFFNQMLVNLLFILFPISLKFVSNDPVVTMSLLLQSMACTVQGHNELNSLHLINISAIS